MAFVFGTSANYQAFASTLRSVAVGTSLQSIDSIVGGGTGYTVGDVLTVASGTGTILATLEVLAAPAGVISSVRIRNAGLYTTAPSDPIGVTGGTGSSATFNATFGPNGWLDRRSVGCPEAAASATVTAGGTGYSVNDQLTVSGGTFTRPAKFLVTSAPGGVVGAVSLLDSGDYASTPANAASTTGGTGSGCTLTVAYGSGDREIILEGSGSGSDEIFVGYKSFFDAGSGARNLTLNGFTGFDPLLAYLDQPGRSPGREDNTSGGAFVLLASTTVTWWISVTPRRIVFVARTGTCYSSGHLGLLNPFATAGEWPYPLCIMGTTTDRFTLPSTSTVSSSGIADPIKHGENDVGPGFVRLASGSWSTVANSAPSSVTARTRLTTGVLVFPGGTLSGITPDTGDDWYSPTGAANGDDFIPQSGTPGTQAIRLIPTINSGGNQYIRFPITLIHSNGSAPGGVLGELDGVYWFEAAGSVVAENRFVDGTDRFTVFQSGVRSDNWAMWALKES